MHGVGRACPFFITLARGENSAAVAATYIAQDINVYYTRIEDRRRSPRTDEHFDK